MSKLYRKRLQILLKLKGYYKEVNYFVNYDNFIK